MEDLQWFYARNGAQQGPVSTDALRQMLSQGTVASADLVWRAGMDNWQPAQSQVELQSPQPAEPLSPNPPPIAPLPVNSGHLPHIPTPDPTNATLAFVLAIVGMVVPCFGFVLGIVAIVLASNAMSAMRRENRRERHGLALAALIIGIIDLVPWPLFTGLVRFHHRW